MHIIINGWFWGDETSGSGQYLHYLIAHLSRLLSKNNSQITVVVPNDLHGTNDWQLPTQIELEWLSLPRLPRQLAKVWWEQITMPQFARQAQGNVLWVPYWAAPLWQPIPTVVTIHDLIPQLLPAYRGGWMQRLYTKLVGKSAQRAAACITVSNASRRDVITHLGIEPTRVHALLSGPNDSIANTSASTELKIREKYRLPEQFFLYLGGFDTRKNGPSVIQAYERYLADGGDPAIKLVIAGRLPKEYSDFFPDLPKIAQQARVAASVHFCGFVEEVDKPMLYELSVGYIFPSLYEGFGMTVIEAMNAGTPVITSRQ